ncbi:hypothetical protein AC1031_010121 [Aphanomyces cochlioides]|nr:hypothetical protein AC1031_010121 [Aphanomyces cochlioides]
MATAISVLFQQLESTYAGLMFEFQDGVYEDLCGRFNELFETTFLYRGVFGLKPSFRAWKACRRNLLTVDAMVYAIQNHKLDIGHFLLPQVRQSNGNISFKASQNLLDVAARSNCFEFMQHLYGQKIGFDHHLQSNSQLVMGISKSFMHAVHAEICEPSILLEVALDHGFPHVVESILENLPKVNTDQVHSFERTSAEKHLDIHQLLFNHEPNAPSYILNAAKAAAYGGHVSILKWLWTNYKEASG